LYYKILQLITKKEGWARLIVVIIS
jgi:hypothetical protein